jgi:GAF domain-containing protein
MAPSSGWLPVTPASWSGPPWPSRPARASWWWGAADGLHAEELAGTVFPVEGSVSGEVIQTAKTVAVPDAAADQRVRQPALRAGGIGPALFAPLAVRGAVLGTLLVANATGGRLSGKGTCS